ncbi:protein transport protein S31 [Ceratocystis pirilliformis]|uniref:Protein transport protein SEC31 n=1 Tax=Ceratocystis pirilliformis TaxID=259994 RepID=A0ABR3ZNC3_9PEZI
MVRLREIQRTAAFAWSPGAAKPLIVTGTRAGAVDADFSDDTKLELWDLELDDFEHSVELQPVASIVSDSRFYDIAWSQPDDTRPNGIIACALENGSLDLYDAAKLIARASAEEALISRTTKHSGAIKSLQFNPIKPHYLATAGAKGELFVYDVNDISSPFRLGAATARPDDLECVAWNRKVSHILASGSAGGLVTVWDLKTKKTSVTLNNNRKPVSAIEWDPDYSTKLITSSFDDTTPVIYLWDLRNTNTPERTMQGHVQGVLSLSWCPQDPNLLLSCGKDSRTLLWNPQNGELFGEFQEGTNWNFSTKFNPHNPSLTATASFDGKIVIQTLQNTNSPTQENANQSGLDGEDFFASAQTQPQETNFTLDKAPRWLERPIGASFGFGGKLVVFKPAASDSRSSKVLITQFSADTGISDATDKFESSLSSGNIISICESKEEAASEDEKPDWTIMKNLAGDDVRDRIVEFLGFTKDDIPKKTEAEAEADAESDKAGATTEKKKDSDDDFFGGDDGEVDEDDFMASLSASKGVKTNDPFSLFNESESIMEQDVTRSLVLGNFEKAVELCIAEKRWADAFLIANCGGAVLAQKVQAQYLADQEGKPSYIRLLNSVIAKNLWDVVHNADLDDWKQTMVVLCTYSSPEDFPDLCEALGDRILESGERKDVAFCYLVGSKLEKVVDIWIAEMGEAREADLKSSNGDNSFSIHARSLQAFIEKVSVFRAVTNFQDSEKDQTKNWKLTSLYDKYTEYADLIAEQGKLVTAQKYLDLLPDIYPPADIARERVKLATTPSKKTTISANTAATNRRALPVRQTATPPSYQPISQPQAPSLASARPPAPSANPYAPTGPNIISSGTAPTQPTNPYGAAPSAPSASVTAPSASPYAPRANAYGSTPSAPQYGGYTPAAAAPIYGAPPQNFSAPPRNTPPPASIAPPSRSKNMMVWNDVPMVAKAPVRRATPTSKPAPITSPFPGGPSPTGPPPSSPGAGLLELSSTPPPPPKGPPMGRVTSPLAGPPGVGAQQGPPRSSSIAANTYAPPPATSSNPISPPMAVPRMNSPYNAPPAAAPPSNRYAPAPASTAQANQPPLAGMMAPPPQVGAHPPPPANPYGPSSAISPTSYPPSGYQASAPPMAGPPMSGPPMGGLPMAGPPRSGPPMGGPPPAGPPMSTPLVAAPPQATPPSQGPPSTAMSPPPAAGAPPQPTGKTYSGDRSNIPANAQRMVEIFTRDMKRVAASAPATYSAQVKDSQKRINILFDCLNKGELVNPDTIEQLAVLAEALDVRDYATAQNIQADIQTNKPDECGKWIVGVKRLLSMSKATP